MPLKIAEKMLADYTELEVLTLELPDSCGEPVDNERERLQITPLLDKFYQCWNNG